MNATELKTAKEILAPHSDRLETAALDAGGQCITAHWLDGGQKLFYAIDAVEAWRDERHPAERIETMSIATKAIEQVNISGLTSPVKAYIAARRKLDEAVKALEALKYSGIDCRKADWSHAGSAAHIANMVVDAANHANNFHDIS